ncbi:MAG TPA: hypothetical protein VFT76_04455 [Actinomycetota bacterium]|nr:hypothetical protein [Actinomycetota bacterium]
MLEIQLPALYRAPSAAPDGEDVPQVAGTAGLREDRGFESSARPLRTVPAAPPIEEDDVGLDPSLVVTDDVVSIDELLVWEGTEEQGPIDTRIGRLASLLGIAAVLIAVLVLVLAAGTDVTSLFRSLPGS